MGRAWPLERLPFARAGSLTLLSVILALLANPWFLLRPHSSRSTSGSSSPSAPARPRSSTSASPGSIGGAARERS
jgi:hypothetical protein